MSMFLKNGEQILQALDTVLEFGQVSGLMLNLDKTEGLCIVSLLGSYKKVAGITWPRIIRYLGVYIGPDTTECQTKKYNQSIYIF